MAKFVIDFPYKRFKKAKQVSLSEMFSSSGFKTVPKNGKKSKWFVVLGRYVLNIFLFLLVSSISGLLLVVWPLIMLSQGAQAVVPAADYWKDLPSILPEIQIGEKNTLYDINGNVFAEVWQENRVKLDSLDQVSDFAEKALIATEDKDFYSHKGFSIRGTLRAFVSGNGGGSGITQQLVKNLQFYNMAGTDKKDEAVEATIERKIKELKLAMNYDKTHSKDEILLQYFNTVAFGGPSIYSIETAAQYFFGVAAKDLSLAQASVLVGSVQNPVLYDLSVEENFDKFKARQYDVLSRMVAENYITQDEADVAYDEPLNFVFKMAYSGNCASSSYPLYCEYVMDTISASPKLAETQEERDAILAKGGLHIKTYLDPDLTNVATEQLMRDYGADNELVAPIAVVQPGTGGVLTMAQNRYYGEGDGKTTINMALHPTGTGSVFKMITLAAALNNGFTEQSLNFSSRCPLIDENYDIPDGGITNSDSCKLQGGKMDYKRATAFSSNTWFAELEIKIGVEKVKDFARSVGLSYPDHITSRSLSYTLGTTEESTVDMAAAFATFANQGIFCPATPIVSYSYKDGSAPVIPETYDANVDSCRRVMSAKDAGTVLKAMRANVSGEIKDAFGIKFNTPKYETVAKSGTNQLFNSTWIVLSGNFSVFANLFNPDSFIDGMDPTLYRGYWLRWFDHPIGLTARDLMVSFIDMKGYKGLDYNNPDDSMSAVNVLQKDYFTVPSVIGMNPEQAVDVFESLNVTVKVSKERKPKPNELFSSNVIVEQSIVAGTQLPVGSRKEVVLYLSE